MAQRIKGNRLLMLCLAFLLCFCCLLVFVQKNERLLNAFAESALAGSGESPVTVQFAQSEVTVQENESFSVLIQAENWDKNVSRNIKVQIEVSDPELDIVNTKITSGNSTMQEMRKKGVIVYAAVNGSRYLTAAKERTAVRSFFIRDKAQSTPLCIGGYYRTEVTGNRVVTVKLCEPPDGRSYTVGANDTLTITLTEVDGKRPVRTSEPKEEWVRANLGWLRNKYPVGLYWNHFVGNSNDPDSVTRVPCQNGKHAGPGEITGMMGVGSSTCNNSSHSMYARYEERDYLFINQNEFSFGQCTGYAMNAAREIFGTQPYDGIGWETFTSSKLWRTLEAGDYVRTENHSFFVVDAKDDLVTVTECNIEGDPCVILWDVQYRLSEDGKTVSRVNGNTVIRPQRIESVSRAS